MRADVAVKLDMTANRANVVQKKIRNHYAETLPRVDTGRVKVPGQGGTAPGPEPEPAPALGLEKCHGKNGP